MMLDLGSVRLFVLAVDLGNLTRAAEAAGTAQPVVSQRLRSLEAALGHRLLDRSPRHVRLTPEGDRFLPHARALLGLHDRAIRFDSAPQLHLALGLSDHAIGIGLEAVLTRLRSALPPQSVLTLHSGLSQDLRRRYDDGALDACVIRREGASPMGEVLGTDPLGWRAADGWRMPADSILPLALLPAPCGLRALALQALDGAGIPWREAFIAGSTAALLAGVRAGLGIAPMGRIASGNLPDLGPPHGLPRLAASGIVLHGRATGPDMAAALRVLAGAIRAELRGPKSGLSAI